MARIPTAILISGRGSNMAALVEAARDPAYPAKIVLVLSSDPRAAGLTAARDAGVATAVVDHRACPDRAAFEADIDAALRAAGAELVCLAGFMRILSGDFVDAWANRILNIHPSLLPAFKGLDTHARVLAAGHERHGATVHVVNADLDAGPVVMQESLAVAPDDTAISLAHRVLEIEHRLYPAALRTVAQDLLSQRRD